jgi:hypothetical protein
VTGEDKRNLYIRKSIRSLSHAPLIIGGVGLDSRKLGDSCVVGSEVAYRIGCGGIAGEREGLRAAAAEIQLATWAACARLLHPCAAAEGVEGRGIRPDIRERTFAYVPDSSPVIDSAAWQGSTLPAGVTLRERRPQPPTHGFG